MVDSQLQYQEYKEHVEKWRKPELKTIIVGGQHFTYYRHCNKYSFPARCTTQVSTGIHKMMICGSTDTFFEELTNFGITTVSPVNTGRISEHFRSTKSNIIKKRDIYINMDRQELVQKCHDELKLLEQEEKSLQKHMDMRSASTRCAFIVEMDSGCYVLVFSNESERELAAEILSDVRWW